MPTVAVHHASVPVYVGHRGVGTLRTSIAPPPPSTLHACCCLPLTELEGVQRSACPLYLSLLLGGELEESIGEVLHAGLARVRELA